MSVTVHSMTVIDYIPQKPEPTVLHLAVQDNDPHVVADINDTIPVSIPSPPPSPPSNSIPEPMAVDDKSLLGKRKAIEPPDDKDDQRPAKRAMHPFFQASAVSKKKSDPSYKPILASDLRQKKPAKPKKTTTKPPKPPKKEKPSLPEAIGLSAGGQSKSAIAEREQRRLVAAGIFEVSTKRWENFQEKCRELDDDAGFDLDRPQEVMCSYCQKWIKMKAVYSLARFAEHRTKPCKAPPPVDDKIQTLAQFGLSSSAPCPCPSATKPVKVSKPCPGLTEKLDARIGYYLTHTSVTGAGSKDERHYSLKHFQKEFKDLDPEERACVRTAQLQDRIWRLDTTPGIMAVFATGNIPCLKDFLVDPDDLLSETPCEPCRLVLASRAFTITLNKQRAGRETAKFTPGIYRNAVLGKIYARYKGLEELFLEVSFMLVLWYSF
jgi:hypothetical protein